MLKRVFYTLCLLALFGALAAWFLSAPTQLDGALKSELAENSALAKNNVATPEMLAKGEQIFWRTGCTSCHVDKAGLKAAKDGGDENAIKQAKLTLSGGMPFKTPFGTFYAPNIAPSDNGIGKFTLDEFALALTQGVSPEGQHYYPAFPYSAYKGMTGEDIAALYHYMQTLPKSDVPSKPHDVGFPFNLRRGLGLWKQLNFYPDHEIKLTMTNPQILRGQYLVEHLAHCGECHTPRDAIGGLDYDNWLGGAVSFEVDSKGQAEKIPNITPSDKGIGSWTHDDIVNGLETGFTPEYDSFGSSMVSVQENMARLPKEDLEAISAYLKAVALR